MSWSVTGTIKGHEAGNAGAFAELMGQALTQNPECGDQFEAASDAVRALVASGVIGSSEKEYHVSMSGHANPEHEPRAGWANDMVTVSVSQK